MDTESTSETADALENSSNVENLTDAERVADSMLMEVDPDKSKPVSNNENTEDLNHGAPVSSNGGTDEHKNQHVPVNNKESQQEPVTNDKMKHEPVSNEQKIVKSEGDHLNNSQSEISCKESQENDSEGNPLNVTVKQVPSTGVDSEGTNLLVEAEVEDSKPQDISIDQEQVLENKDVEMQKETDVNEDDITEEDDDDKSNKENKQKNTMNLINKYGYLDMTMDIFHKMRETFGNDECEYCGKLYYNKTDFETHLRTHTGKGPVNIYWGLGPVHFKFSL